MTLKNKIILQVSVLCLILGVGSCYLFLGTYRIQQRLQFFTPATAALIAVADVDSALASEQRMLWSELASGRNLTEIALEKHQREVLEAFERMLLHEQRQMELGVFGETDSIAQIESLVELYKLWQQRSQDILAKDPSGRSLVEPARMLIEDQIFPGLEYTAEHAVYEVQEAYADLEEALGFFPWMQAGARTRIRNINADLAFVLGGNHVYALLNRQFAALQAYRINGRKEDLSGFQALFSMTEDVLSRWQEQAVARLRLNVEDPQRSVDLDKVSAVEEGYSLLRDLAGDALLRLPAEEASAALDGVMLQIRSLVQGNLRPTVMTSLKSGVEGIQNSTTIANQLGVSAFAVLLLLIVFQSVRSVRSLLKSFEVLRFGIEAFQSGNLAHRVALRGEDEFSRLGESLNQMAGQLENSRQEVEDLNVSLERKVEERTLLLEEASRELKAFNYMVSHDLRNPLSAVLGLSQVLLEKARMNGDDDQVPLQHVVKGAERIDLTITALLSLSQFSFQALHYDVVDFATLAGQISEEMAGDGRLPEIECQNGDDLKAAADPDLMRLVMENLLQNAVNYADPDRPLRVEIGRSETPKGQAFFVRDNGLGFDPEQAGNLFAPFARLHESSDIPGKGIGLAVVQRIIQRHGGEVWAESIPGQGSCFYFVLGDPQEGASA